MLGVFVAFASALWVAVYFTDVSSGCYVDRAHAEPRQKEDAGHRPVGGRHRDEIANPLDGVQNCLRRIGERVKDDRHLTDTCN